MPIRKLPKVENQSSRSKDNRLPSRWSKIRQEFIDRYIAAFLGSHAAVNYAYNCARGWPDDSQPVEDAQMLAEQAWDQLAAERKSS